MWTEKNMKDYKAFLANEKHIVNLYKLAGINEYTPFNKTSALVLKGNNLSLLRMLLHGLKRMGISNVYKYITTGELPFDDPSS
jgi:hypothetical protein